MKLLRPCSLATILVLLFRVIRPGAAGGTSSIHEVNESPTCDERSTAMYSTINPIPCTVTTPCVEEMGVQGNSTRYDFCHYTQDEYLKDAYGDTPYVLLKHYDDTNCEQLTSTDVYRADGKCHNSLNYALQVFVSANGTVTVKSRTKMCELGDWGDVFDPVPKANVNTGLCFPMEIHSAKLYLVYGTNATSSASSSGSGSASDTITTALSSSTSALPTVSLTLGLAVLAMSTL